MEWPMLSEEHERTSDQSPFKKKFENRRVGIIWVIKQRKFKDILVLVAQKKKQWKSCLSCETIDSASFLSETRVERPVHRTSWHTRSTQLLHCCKVAWLDSCQRHATGNSDVHSHLSPLSTFLKKMKKNKRNATWISSTPKSNYELFNCSNFNICYWSWNYRGCWHQTCPPIVPRRERDLNWTHSDCKPFL